jgi:hypothetical protein
MAFELVRKSTTGAGLFYAGRAEQATVDINLPPEQLPGSDWIAERVINGFIEATRGEGTLLQAKVYADFDPWLYARYRVVATAHASPIAWPAVILTALIVAGIAIIGWILRDIANTPWLGVGLIGLGIGGVVLGTTYLIKSGGRNVREENG